MSEWQRFAELLTEENRRLAELGEAALRLTDALVRNEPDAIETAERRVEAQRVLHGTAYAQRVAMQRRGFGKLTLAQVCAYAPPALRRPMYASVKELETRGLALKLTVSNNKALILAGMERLARTVAVLQRAGTEQSGTYRRRGVVPPPDGSVIVSRRA
ncbi:MAG TPA: flagellar export chaperone FlgN [Candidatus Elarobacter sp.]|nr:flagellar export chaperone FlgN [Candidatus Elarobacter sp.]